MYIKPVAADGEGSGEGAEGQQADRTRGSTLGAGGLLGQLAHAVGVGRGEGELDEDAAPSLETFELTAQQACAIAAAQCVASREGGRS